jgi:hypothetical protein
MNVKQAAQFVVIVALAWSVAALAQAVNSPEINAIEDSRTTIVFTYCAYEKCKESLSGKIVTAGSDSMMEMLVFLGVAFRSAIPMSGSRSRGKAP